MAQILFPENQRIINYKTFLIMKKKEAIRNFNFSDAILITKGKEKIAFIRRDASKFTEFGISGTDVDELENNIDLFAENITDIEAVSDQAEITSLKTAKAEELRVAIRAIMMRVELKYGTTSAKYRKFGTDMLTRQTDADLLMTGKRVVRVAQLFLTDLVEKGVTPAMLTEITALCDAFENLIIDMKIKVGDRDIMQEARVETANAIYATLVSYATTGQSIWTTTNVAKYNDYLLYNTVTGEILPTETPVVA